VYLGLFDVEPGLNADLGQNVARQKRSLATNAG
jgi:hypothetical protein